MNNIRCSFATVLIQLLSLVVTMVTVRACQNGFYWLEIAGDCQPCSGICYHGSSSGYANKCAELCLNYTIASTTSPPDDSTDVFKRYMPHIGISVAVVIILALIIVLVCKCRTLVEKVNKWFDRRKLRYSTEEHGRIADPQAEADVTELEVIHTDPLLGTRNNANSLGSTSPL